MVRIRPEQIRGRVLSTPPTDPSEEDLYLDDGTNTESGTLGFRRYDGSLWEDFGLQSGAGGSSTLKGLSDVSITSVANSNRLVYDTASSKWKNEDTIDGGTF